jgi:hypothetical protein
VVTASFTVDNVDETPALVATPASVAFTAVEGSDPAAQSVVLSTTTGTSASFTVSEAIDWLAAEPATGATPSSLDLTATTASLAPGTYVGTVTVSAPGFLPTAVAVTATVRAAGSTAFELLASTSSTRSSPVPLAGRVVSGNIFVFVGDAPGISQVRFWLDQPAMTGAPRKVESGAPWDFAGTATNGSAKKFDTRKVSNGSHTITAEVTANGQVTVIHATFTVAN